MKIGLIVIGFVFMFLSCQEKRNQDKINENLAFVERAPEFDMIKWIEKINKESLNDTAVDVLQYFDEEELPNIYRLGGVSYQPYLLEGEIAKVILVFEGDRETIRESYCFDKKKEVFYMTRIYSVYDPPKWEKGSTEISSKESGYFIDESKILKSFGNDTIDTMRIVNSINKVLFLVRTLE